MRFPSVCLVLCLAVVGVVRATDASSRVLTRRISRDDTEMRPLAGEYDANDQYTETMISATPLSQTGGLSPSWLLLPLCVILAVALFFSKRRRKNKEDESLSPGPSPTHSASTSPQISPRGQPTSPMGRQLSVTTNFPSLSNIHANPTGDDEPSIASLNNSLDEPFQLSIVVPEFTPAPIRTDATAVTPRLGDPQRTPKVRRSGAAYSDPRTPRFGKRASEVLAAPPPEILALGADPNSEHPEVLAGSGVHVLSVNLAMNSGRVVPTPPPIQPPIVPILPLGQQTVPQLAPVPEASARRAPQTLERPSAAMLAGALVAGAGGGSGGAGASAPIAMVKASEGRRGSNSSTNSGTPIVSSGTQALLARRGFRESSSSSDGIRVPPPPATPKDVDYIIAMHMLPDAPQETIPEEDEYAAEYDEGLLESPGHVDNYSDSGFGTGNRSSGAFDGAHVHHLHFADAEADLDSLDSALEFATEVPPPPPPPLFILAPNPIVGAGAGAQLSAGSTPGVIGPGDTFTRSSSGATSVVPAQHQFDSFKNDSDATMSGGPSGVPSGANSFRADSFKNDADVPMMAIRAVTAPASLAALEAGTKQPAPQ